MDISTRELRAFVTAAETGSFTDAAAELRVSQAAISRSIAAFEGRVGERVLRRVPRGCELTPIGQLLLPHAKRVIAEIERFGTVLRERHGVLRLGYAWAALGRHTARLQREWTSREVGSDLELVRHNSATAGLIEGQCDVAVMRRPLEDDRLESVVVGLERRLVAFASDDALWARRRQLSLAELAERTVIVDPRAGTTSEALWAGFDRMPRFIHSSDIDSWLDAIIAGRGVGSTAEGTAYHHPRPGVTYRPVKDGPRIPVRLAWWRDQPPRDLPLLIDAATALYADAV